MRVTVPRLHNIINCLFKWCVSILKLPMLDFKRTIGIVKLIECGYRDKVSSLNNFYNTLGADIDRTIPFYVLTEVDKLTFTVSYTAIKEADSRCQFRIIEHLQP